MTKFQYYYEKEGQRVNLGRKSRNDFQYAILHDRWNCGNTSFHTSYEKALKRFNWNLNTYNEVDNKNLELVKVHFE